MAKKFIRHLEFYGFPDQNIYESEIGGGCNVDLSEIIRKNDEQDKEIRDLTDEKASQKDLDELSGTVISMIEIQSEINQGFADAISGNTEKIGVITDKVNEIGDTVNDAMCGIQILGDRVDGLDSKFTVLSGKVDTLSAETASALTGIQEQLDNKLDKDEAEGIYAKKEDVYTKQETDDRIDEKLEPYATKEWIQDTGYITQSQGDERYAKKETVDALSNRVNDAVTDLNTKIYTVSGNLITFSSDTNARMSVLDTNFETLRSEVNRKVNEISGSVDTLSSKVTSNTNAIRDLENDVARKAEQVDLEALQTRVTSLSDVVDTKVGKPEFETYKSLVANQFNDMDNKKADKSAFTQAMDAIQGVNDRLDQEITDRIAGDDALQNQIDALDGEIEQLGEELENYSERVTAVESGLTKEIADRKQADLDLIGTENDDKDDDTIWGAKKYANWQKSAAVDEANGYTDDKVTEINSRIDQEHEWAEQNFSSAASKSYVDSMVNDLEEELETEITNAVNDENERATSAEADLLRRIITVIGDLGENDRLLNLLTNRVNAITAWDGTDPSEYVNTGNGVLDVLHREFHEYVRKDGIIESIVYEDGNLIITYKTQEGERVVTIPIGDILDLTDYYKKEETDALLNKKLDVSAYTDISDQVTANTQSIARLQRNKLDASAYTDVSDQVTENTQNIARLQRNKLDASAYTDVSDQVTANTQSIEALKNDKLDASAYTDVSDQVTANTQSIEALKNDKLDASAYTDVSDQVTANTQSIEALSGAIENEVSRATSAETALDEKIDDETARATSAETELQDAISGASGALDALINRLGYTDNDTLVKHGDHEAAFGQYNVSNESEDPSGRTIFSIGNGTDDENRSNALEVRENGDIYIWVEGDFMNINKLLGQIAHEVYDSNDETHNSHFFDGD